MKENFAHAQKSRTGFGEYAKLFEALTGLDAKLTLNRPPLSQKLKDIFIRKEIQFRLDGNSTGEIVGDASTESWLRHVRGLEAFARRREQRERGELHTHLNFLYVWLRRCRTSEAQSEQGDCQR